MQLWIDVIMLFIITNDAREKTDNTPSRPAMPITLL